MNTPHPRPQLKMRTLEQLIQQIHHEVQIQGWKADLNHLDVSSLKSFESLFATHAHGLETFNGNISRWDMSNALTLRDMFHGSFFKGDLSKWDVSKVIDMEGLFMRSRFNGDISQWNTSNVKFMLRMFSHSSFNQPIGQWDVSKVVNMAEMFCDNPRFNQPIEQWDVSRVESMAGMFVYSNFNQPLEAWNVQNLIESNSMFYSSAFNQPLSSWNVRNLENAASMFESTGFEHDLSQWNLENLTNGFSMFAYSKVKAVPIPKKHQERKYVNFVGYIDHTPLFEQLAASGYKGRAHQDPYTPLLFQWIDTKVKQKHLEQHLHSSLDPTPHPRKIRL